MSGRAGAGPSPTAGGSGSSTSEGSPDPRDISHVQRSISHRHHASLPALFGVFFLSFLRRQSGLFHLFWLPPVEEVFTEITGSERAVRNLPLVLIIDASRLPQRADPNVENKGKKVYRTRTGGVLGLFIHTITELLRFLTEVLGQKSDIWSVWEGLWS